MVRFSYITYYIVRHMFTIFLHDGYFHAALLFVVSWQYRYAEQCIISFFLSNNHAYSTETHM